MTKKMVHILRVFSLSEFPLHLKARDDHVPAYGMCYGECVDREVRPDGNSGGGVKVVLGRVFAVESV